MNDDSVLVEKARAGDRTAFGELVRRYQTDVRYFLRRRLNDATVADDLAQDVFLGAMNSIERFRESSSVRSWLLTIARYKMIDYLRAETRKKTADEFELAMANESLRRVEQESTDESTIQTLKDCIKKLQPNARMILKKFYFENIGAIEIAKLSEQKPSTVRMTLLRIRRALGKCIKKSLGDSFQK